MEKWGMNVVKALQCLLLNTQLISVREGIISHSPEIIKNVLSGTAGSLNG